MGSVAWFGFLADGLRDEANDLKPEYRRTRVFMRFVLSKPT
jgi:hypothetical protein